MKALMDATSEMAMLIDSDGTILEINDAFAKMLEKGREEVVGARIFDQTGEIDEVTMVPHEALLGRWSRTKDVVRTGVRTSFQDTHLGRTFKHTIEPILGLSGKVERMAVFVREITEEIRTSQSLRESEERFRSFVESASDAILITDEEGPIIEVNAAVLSVMEMEKEDLLGLKIWDLHHRVLKEEKRTPEALAHLVEMYQEALRTGKGDWLNVIIEDDMHLPTGQEMTLQMAFWVMPTGSGHRLAISIRDVTQQKRSEEALRESEEKFREFICQSLDAIMLWDEEGRLTDFNPAALKVLGLDEASLRSMDGWTLHRTFLEGQATPERMEEMRNAYSEAYRTGQAPFFNKVMDITYHRGDGEVRIGQFAIFPIRTARGFGVGAIIRDATEAKSMERAALESEQRLRGFFDSAFEGVYITDCSGRTVECNQAFLDIVEIHRDELIGMSVWDLMYRFVPDEVRAPEQYEMIKQRCVTALEKGEMPFASVPLLMRMRMRDGVEKQVEQTQFAFRCEGGHQIGSMFRDITDRVRAEERVKQNEENYHTPFDSLLDSLLIFDIETGEVVDCNLRPVQYLGFSSVEEMLAEGWEKGEHSREGAWEAIRKALSDGSGSFEWGILTNDGRSLEVEVRV
jgi:PAS domain S-box-containing protein